MKCFFNNPYPSIIIFRLFHRQLFEIFDSVGNATLDRMNLIIKYAVDLCTLLYIAVGVLGYIAYYKTAMTGWYLMTTLFYIFRILFINIRRCNRKFADEFFRIVIQRNNQIIVCTFGRRYISIGDISLQSIIVFSTFQKGNRKVIRKVLLFSCFNSRLLFQAHVPHYELVTGGGNHIPEAQFKCITLFIITVSLIVGLLAPNIEIVLGLVGSTIGVVICLLFPPLLFLWISTKHTTEKVLAQVGKFFHQRLI